MKKIIFIFSLLTISIYAFTQKTQEFHILSPNGKIDIAVSIGENIQWSVKHENTIVLLPSAINLQLSTGEVLGEKIKISSTKKQTINESGNTLAYKKDKIENNCNQLTIACNGDYGIVFRAYDDGVAYRFFTNKKDSITILSEKTQFNFDKNYIAFIPHVSDTRGGEKYTCSFEEFYNEAPISTFNKDTLAYLPFMVALDNNKKAVFIEADVQDYPCMFIQHNVQTQFGIQATHAPYPLEEALGGYNKINYMVTKRANFIAKTNGTKQFPWRAIVISTQDKELLNNDMVQKLSAPNKISNTKWIKPGKVAWDWWNDWNITHVDFVAGINTPTYKYYIDFAAANNIEYVVLDEGWSNDWDLNKLNPAIDLTTLIDYSKPKNVGLILWTTWYALSLDMEGLCAKYEALGIKGFKVDFLDRNDQKMVTSCYKMAEVAAKHHLLLDFHGMFAPQGLQATWPNVVNFEGVRGMEYSKWSANEKVPRHEVSIPFIRMVAGPMDYTPGAMRNETKGNAKPSNNNPVSQGTRCHQMAMYVVYEAPLQMMADNPSIYMKEQDCTNMIARVPTTFNETIALDGKVGDYIIMARRKNNTWFVGAMSNWDARDITVDCSFLGKGSFEAEIFKDGINATRNATDYKKEMVKINADTKLPIHMAPGGGFIMSIKKL